MHYLIIGNSAAGIGAAEAIRETDASGSIAIISDEPESAYSRALISYELAGWLGLNAKLDLRSPEFYLEKNIQTILGHRALKIDAAKREVHLDDGRKIAYDKLLLATGGSPQKTGVKVYPTAAPAPADVVNFDSSLELEALELYTELVLVLANSLAAFSRSATVDFKSL